MKRPWKADTSAGSSPEPAGSLPRARTGASGSIRGRISGPIPIPSPMDEEFPMRHPGTGIAKPLDAAAAADDDKEIAVDPPTPEKGKQSPVTPPATASPAPAIAPAVAQNPSPDPEPAQTQTQTPEPRPVTVLRNSPRRGTTMSSTLRYSMASQDTTAHTGSSRDKPQRKKSTLRGALGKLFGRKKKDKKNGSQGSTVSSDKLPPGGSTQHHSDPTALNRTISRVETNRSASMPITEFDRALRSHSVGPEDVMAIESARNSLSADFTLSRARSAGTRLSGSARRTEGGLTGLSPRPASTHGRGSALVYGSDDPEQIGRAITSDFSGLKRRSRSMSGLPAIDDDQTKKRRRSDEIRYWRESHGPPLTSPISSNLPEGEDPTAAVFEISQSVADLPPKTPPQPFIFGDIASMNEMAGMKITHAASMDTRIGSLEARTRRLEKVVTQLCNAVPNFRPHVENIPDRAPTAQAEPASRPTTAAAPDPFGIRTSGQDLMSGSTRPSTRHSEMSKISSIDGPTFVGGFPRPPVPQAFGSTKQRPLSTATIRGAASLPTLSKDMTAPFTIDHYMTLMALIETERSARLALEAEVRRLGRQLKLTGRTSGYARTTLGGDGPPTGYSLGETSAFDEDDDEEDDDDDYGAGSGTKQPRRSSVLPEDSGIGTGHDGDDISEPFATPREEGRPFTPAGVDADADEEAKKAARTLSLSQLTYNSTPPTMRQENAPQPI